MKETDKENFNNWANENADKLQYVKLFINAFEDAYLCLSDVENEQARNKLAFDFIEMINGYIQEKKIQEQKTDNRRLNTIFERVKRGIDAGFVDYMNVCKKNTERTETARQAKRIKADAGRVCEETGETETAETLYFKYWKQAENKIYFSPKYMQDVESKKTDIQTALEKWVQNYWEQDKARGFVPIVHPKSKEQDARNTKLKDEIIKRACYMFGNAIGRKIPYGEFCESISTIEKILN